MADSVRLTINMDPEVKEQGRELFEQLGMDYSTAVNLFIRQSLREKAIPFNIALYPEKKEELKW